MTKKLKSAFSLLFAGLMLLSVMPAAMAAEIAIEPPTVTTFGTGVSYFNDSCSAELLTNGYYFTAKEVAEPGATGGTYANLYGDTEKAELVTFSEANSGIEYKWDSEQSVKRLELWILGVGGVRDYEVQSSEDGSSWTPVTEGSFADYSDYQNPEGVYRASYYPIIFDEQVTTKYLRFEIKSFQDDTNGAKIAETRVSDTNEINLGDNAYFSDELGKNPYLWGYNSSGSSQSGNSYTSSNGRGFMWASTGSKTLTVQEGTEKDDAADGIWYVTTFDRSLVKVNKIGLTVSGGSSISQFEVWATAAMDYEFTHYGKDPNSPDTTNWTKVATIDCDISSSNNSVVFELPNAIEARAYFIKIPSGKYGADTALTSIQMYAVADSETSGVAAAAENIFDSITTDTDDNDVAETQISGLSDSFTYEGKTYSVTWQSSSELIDLATGAIGFHEDEVEITLTAKLTAEGVEGATTTVSKTFTLLPLENERTVTVSADVTFSGGSDASVLTDGFLFSSYDRAVNGNITAADSPEKFAKVTAGSYIDYSWLAMDKVRRLELWAYPAEAIKEYEIQTSDDGETWTPHASGDVSENIKPGSSAGYENQAVYMPILFDLAETQHMRFVVKSLADGAGEAYIAEAMLVASNEINLAAAPKDAQGTYSGYSHYMASYVMANTSDPDIAYRKSSTAIWPTYSDGTSPDVTPSGSEVWYATAFATTPVNINRVVVPVSSGSATEVELLCAAGEESGFELTEDYPAAPDTVADWKTVAVVRGTFNAENAASIDITDAPSSKYWMVRVKNASQALKLGRVGFYLVDDSEFSPLTTVTSKLFDSVETDYGMAADNAKTWIRLMSSVNHEGVDYPIIWESSSSLLNLTTGDISEHEKDEYITLTAIIAHPDNSSISYCVSKEFLLEGMLTVSVFDENGKTEDEGVLTDRFTYSIYDRTQVLQAPINACYNPDKFVWFDKVNSGFEFYMDKPKVLKRLELWLWTFDSVRDYEIQVSNDGSEWTTHYSGTIIDQYADNPNSRPTDTSDAAGTSAFYPIVFDSPTEPVNYIRFVIKSFRDEAQGAYVAEAFFGDTNDVDYLALGTNKGAEGGNLNRSIYTKRFYSSEVENFTASYRRNSYSIWPIYSNGNRLALLPREGDLLWYVTGFQEAPVAVNKVEINVSKGEVYEYEVLCPATSVTGIAGGDYPVRPDTVAEWKTIARVSGRFTGTSEIHFDNDFASMHWMVKITQASDDVRMNRVGLYTLGEYEMNKSSFILDRVFDVVSDTAIDNVIKEEMTLPASLTIDGEQYNVLWSYDDTMVNPDGTLTESLTDREMVLTARVGAADEDYKHVLEKTYYLLGNDDRARTALYSGENISLTDAGEQICSAKLENGFTYSGKKELDIDFASGDVSGKIQLMSGETLLTELTVKEGQLIANAGGENEVTVPLTDKIKLGIENGAFSLAGADDAIYTTLLYNEALLSDGVFDTVKLVTADVESLAIDRIAVTAVSEDLFASIEEQFVFSKISPYIRRQTLTETSP